MAVGPIAGRKSTHHIMFTASSMCALHWHPNRIPQPVVLVAAAQATAILELRMPKSQNFQILAGIQHRRFGSQLTRLLEEQLPMAERISTSRHKGILVGRSIALLLRRRTVTLRARQPTWACFKSTSIAVYCLCSPQPSQANREHYILNGMLSKL